MHYLCTLWHALPHMLLCELLTSVHAVHTCLGAHCLVCLHALPISVRQLLSRPIMCTKLASLVTSTLLAITTHATFLTLVSASMHTYTVALDLVQDLKPSLGIGLYGLKL